MHEPANFKDCAANSGGLAARNPQKTAIRPDGGVVTQRTANPQSSQLLSQQFARFTVCSTHGKPWVFGPTANYSPTPSPL